MYVVQDTKLELSSTANTVLKSIIFQLNNFLEFAVLFSQLYNQMKMLREKCVNLESTKKNVEEEYARVWFG